MTNCPTLVSFYTLDEYYGFHANNLMTKIKQLNDRSAIKFTYDFKIYSRKPGDTWSKITFAKPVYIREWLDKYEHIIWIDIDSKLNRLPTMPSDYMIDSPYDLAAIDRGDGVALDYLWYVRRTPATLKFFEDIASKIKKEYEDNLDVSVREGGDHDAVLKVLAEYKVNNPERFGLLGDGSFGLSNGWVTYGISGNERGPKIINRNPRRIPRPAVIRNPLRRPRH